MGKSNYDGRKLRIKVDKNNDNDMKIVETVNTLKEIGLELYDKQPTVNKCLKYLANKVSEEGKNNEKN